jgi:hypothetical protein
VVNLAYMNASNGMFWYAIDKVRSLGDKQANCLLLVRENLAPLVARELPLVRVEAATRIGALVKIAGLKLRMGEALRIVSFTSHPIPFLSRQTIAFYDDYPFQGSAVARVKRLLFVVAARSSRSRIGIINRSLALPFLQRCGIAEDRIFFDSAFPAVDVRNVSERSMSPGTPLRIGLVGTDSLKKDYAAIFTAARAVGAVSDVQFLLYGAENDYTKRLRRDFPEIDQTVIASDNVDIPTYFAAIDYLVSASTAEGYGRPMGLAAMLGVPLFLLRSPVFLEFFGEHAQFFDAIEPMLKHIVTARPPASVAGSPEIAAVSARSRFFD